MKKTLLIVFFIAFSSSFAHAQISDSISTMTIEEAFRPKMPNQMDTIYYPFYDGVQMIEVDHIGFWDRKIFFLEQSQPRAMPHSMFNPMPIGNEYFFRDTTGTIVKAFNTKKSLSQLTKHFKNTPIDKKSTGIGFFFPSYHSKQGHRDGVWYQSPQPMFNFSGYYKVSTGYAEQTSTFYGDTDSEQFMGFEFGLIDSLGNVVIPIEYNNIVPYYNKLLVQKEGKWGMLNYQNEIIVPTAYDSFEYDQIDRIDTQKKANVFFLTSKGMENYNPTYTYNAVYLIEENNLLMLNDYDELFHDRSWSPLEDASKRLIYISKDGKKGLMNEDYKEIVSPQYEIFEFNRNTQGLYRVAKNGKFGFWDKNFNEIIPLEYDYAESFSADSTALVLGNGEFYRINTKNEKQTGGRITPGWKTGPLSFKADKNFASVQTSDMLGIVDVSTYSIVLPFAYQKSLTPLKVNSFYKLNKALFEENNMKLADSPDMVDEILFHQNKIIVQNEDNQFGVMDTSFNMIFDFQYDNLEAIQCNLNYLLYTQDGKFGAMDFSGKEVLSEEYEEIRYDLHYEQEWDIFKVKKKGKWGVVNFENETILPCEYDSIKFLGHWNRPKEKLWVVSKNKKFGVVDENNKIFVPFQYRWISHLEGNNLWIEDKHGERVKVYLRN